MTSSPSGRAAMRHAEFTYLERRLRRCGTIAYHDIDELRVSHGRIDPELALVSADETRTLSPYEPAWVDRLTSVLMMRSACTCVSEPRDHDAIIDSGYCRRRVKTDPPLPVEF
jgi:hypothetical protein